MSIIKLPTTQELVEVPDAASERALDAALDVIHAEHSSRAWSADHLRRSCALQAWADALKREEATLVAQLVRETGKIAAEAHQEISGACQALQFNAGRCRSSRDEFHELSDGNRAVVRREPLGPTVFITPWNWPILLLIRDLAPAFAAGVTAVVKPSSQTFLVTRRVIELGVGAGVPQGALQLVAGEAATGQALIEDPRTRGVAITGSTAAGQIVMSTAAKTMTRPLLELGGKATSVILPGTVLRTPLEVLGRASIITAGQMCMACTRILVHTSQFDEAIQILSEGLRDFVVGDPSDEATDIGPLIGEIAFEKVASYVQRAREENVLVAGGERVHVGGLRGYFIRPVLIAGALPTSSLVQEDIFGPILSVEPYDSVSAAVHLANATPFGLAASVWGEDTDRARAVADVIDAGTVWLNRYNASYPEIPSGGFKLSGLGRTRGVVGVDQFSEVKAIIDGPRNRLDISVDDKADER